MENISIEQVNNQIKIHQDKFDKALMNTDGFKRLLSLKKSIEYWKEVKANLGLENEYKKAS